MIAEQIAEYVNYLSYEKHFSAHTILAYETDLSQFSQFVQLQFEVDDTNLISHQHIRSWLVELMNNEIDARSVSRKLSSLRGFYKFLLRENLVTKNPVSKVQGPKARKKLPSFVEESPMTRLFDLDKHTKATKNDDTKEADEEDRMFPDTFEGRRDRLMLLLFYTCGIRLSELIGLKIPDINAYQQTIKVLGKRNKERIIPITKELGTELESYLAEKDLIGLKNDYLFVVSSGEKLYPKMVYNTVKLYLSKVTTIEKRSPHVLRHTYATHLLNNGADLNAIKELLGHASLAATQVYTHNSIERLKNIHKMRHPRA
ncbi:MAG: tyrosine-type recombinase/integrase [Bacteroidota bacterium]